MATRDDILSAMATALDTIPSVNVIRSAAHPGSHWQTILKTNWPTDSSSLVVIWGGIAEVNADEKDNGSGPVRYSLNVEVWGFVNHDNNSTRDTELCDLFDDIRDAIRSDMTLGGDALWAGPESETPNREIVPPYAGGYVNFNILFRR